MCQDSSVSQRKCSVCRECFPLTPEYWHRDRGGFTYACKVCARARTRKWNVDNQDYTLERHRIYYAENKERVHKPYRAANAEYIAAWKREWRATNPDKVKKHKSDSQKRHRASANERSKRNRQRHPDIIRANVLTRIALKKSAPGKFTPADIEAHYELQCGLCAYCGICLYDDYEIDHVIALTRGGSNWPDNLMLACPTCNQSKNNLSLEEWQAKRGW